MNAPTLSLASCHDLHAAVPYLLGFHPQKSVALLLLRDDAVEVAVRFHLPTVRTVERWKIDVAELLGRHEATTVAIAAYGDVDETGFAAQAALSVAGDCGLTVVDVLRVYPDSYFAASCITNFSCPFDGHPTEPIRSHPADGLTPRQRRRRAAGFASLKPSRLEGPVEPVGWLKAAFDAELDRLGTLLREQPETAIDQIHAEGIDLLDV